MKKGLQAKTASFKSQQNAKIFIDWLLANEADSDYGCPKFVKIREVIFNVWEVDYLSNDKFVQGIATGIAWNQQHGNK